MSEIPTTNAADLVGASFAMTLTSAELAGLDRLGFSVPLVSSVPPSDPGSASTREELAGRALVDDSGRLSVWFAPLWQLVTQPLVMCLVERSNERGDRWAWSYAVDEHAYVEQTVCPDGVALMLGVLSQLPGRMLATAGVMRFSSLDDASALDPLADLTTWSVAVRCTSRRRTVGVDARCVEGAWTVDGDVATARSIAERVVSAIEESTKPAEEADRPPTGPVP